MLYFYNLFGNKKQMAKNVFSSYLWTNIVYVYHFYMLDLLHSLVFTF